MNIVHTVYERGRSETLTPNGGTDDEHDVFHRSFRPGVESVDTVLVESVSVIHNVDEDELDPLYDTVDPDALTGLFEGATSDESNIEEVQFVYEELEVTIVSDGHIWLEWV